MLQPIAKNQPPESSSTKCLLNTRSLWILLIADTIGALAGIVTGITSSAVDHLPTEIAVAAGVVTYVLTVFGLIGTLQQLVKS